VRDSIVLRCSQVKLAKLEAHYDLYEETLGSRFDTRLVPGVGNVNSPVVFVGESPGANEDRLGEPFVGPSGKLLGQGLRRVGLKRDRVFITNFLKYRPPDNRDPEGDEIAVSLQLLEWELKILAPKVVVTLGRFSTSLFFPQPHMGTLAGQAWVKRGFTIVPMYHPASVLYGGQDKEGWLEDFDTVCDVMAGVMPKQTTNGHRRGLRKAPKGTR